MGHLRLYSDKQGRSALTESGFSWLAACCLPAWALRQHLYGFALVSLLLLTAEDVLLVHSRLSSSSQWVVYVLLLVANGFVAGPLQRWLLERRGLVVTAEGPLAPPKVVRS